MTYDELQKKYIQVCNENMRLRAENQDLRKQLGIFNSPKEVVVTDSTINKHSSVDDKIDLYMSLFIGRNDVYTKRWYSLQSEKSGYQPACNNEWSEVCNKQKYKSSRLIATACVKHFHFNSLPQLLTKSPKKALTPM